MKYQGKPMYYAVDQAGCDKDIQLNDGLYQIHANQIIDQVKRTDISFFLLEQ